jgi:hypothetical protein
MLLVESRLNRQALIAEVAELHSATQRLSNAILAPRRFAPLLMGLAPLAGFFAFRGARQPGSLLTRAIKLAKWIGPAVSLWRSYAAAHSRHADPS